MSHSHINLLKDFISINSVNSQCPGTINAEKDFANHLANVLRKKGYDVILQDIGDGQYNVLCLYEVDPKKTWIFFDSHMDTVGIDNMIIPPFDPVVKDGKMYGRGTCDTKASGTSMIFALDKYASGRKKENNIAILFTADEEIGKKGVAYFCDEVLERKFDNVSGVVIGEPTELAPVIAHCGVIRFRLETSGTSCHSSMPYLGESAISNMMEVIKTFESGYIPSLAEREEHTLCGKRVCSINTISGGTGVNIIPNFCTAEVDRRVVPGENPNEAFEEIKDIVKSLKNQYKCSINGPQILEGGMHNEDNEPFIENVKEILKNNGILKEESGQPFGTDGTQFSQKNIPCIVLGPGSITQAHTKDEWIELNQLDPAVEVYRQIMEKS